MGYEHIQRLVSFSSRCISFASTLGLCMLLCCICVMHNCLDVIRQTPPALGNTLLLNAGTIDSKLIDLNTFKGVNQNCIKA